jgi:leucyl-tRNA synthetase
MDTFVDSSWYMYRYASPHFDQGPFDTAKIAQWAPVDQYTGGAEHAVMHLLYARFFTKAIRDLGLIDFSEPFLRLFNQGTVIHGGHKMSKSRGNVIAPDVYVGDLGADIVRLYLMFMGPWEGGGDWSDTGINGVARWVNRAWDLCLTSNETLPDVGAASDRDVIRLTHQTIRRVIQDIERFKYNTAISAMMEMTNQLAPIHEAAKVSKGVWKDTVSSLLLLLAPLAPHITEEMWERTGHTGSIHARSLPAWDESLAAIDEAVLIIQINGKVRDKITVPADITEDQAKQTALASDKVIPYTKGKTIDKIVFVPGRYLISVVVKG